LQVSPASGWTWLHWLPHQFVKSLQALATFNRDAGHLAEAVEYAQRLARLAPDDRQIADLVDALKRQMNSSPQ